MSTLNAFSQKGRDYYRYQSRQEAPRQQRAIQRALDEARENRRAAMQAAEAERRAKEDALAQVARLKALLSQRHER